MNSHVLGRRAEIGTLKVVFKRYARDVNGLTQPNQRIALQNSVNNDTIATKCWCYLVALQRPAMTHTLVVLPCVCTRVMSCECSTDHTTHPQNQTSRELANAKSNSKTCNMVFGSCGALRSDAKALRKGESLTSSCQSSNHPISNAEQRTTSQLIDIVMECTNTTTTEQQHSNNTTATQQSTT